MLSGYGLKMINITVVGMWLLTLAGFTGLVNKKKNYPSVRLSGGGFMPSINTCNIKVPFLGFR